MRGNYVGFKAMDMGFDAHLTIAYYGKLTEGEELRIKNFISHPLWYGPVYVVRDKLDLFGAWKSTPVLRVGVPDIIYQFHDELLAAIPSEYHKDDSLPWTPHITLKFDKADIIHIPKVIQLNYLGIY